MPTSGDPPAPALIRAATREDAAAIAEITNYYILHTPIHFGVDPVSAESMAKTWSARSDRHPWVVVELPGMGVVGYAKAGIWRERAAYAATAETGLYVRHGLGGRGLGTLLYQRLITDCRARGLHTLTAGVALPNDASERLHRSCGFVHIGTFRQVGWKFNAWHDVAFYQLMLG